MSQTHTVIGIPGQIGVVTVWYPSFSPLAKRAVFWFAHLRIVAYALYNQVMAQQHHHERE